MSDRKSAFKGFKTQAEVDAAIDRTIRIGETWEAKRERAAFESVEYWHAHDMATAWFERARRLMPKGS